MDKKNKTGLRNPNIQCPGPGNKRPSQNLILQDCLHDREESLPSPAVNSKGVGGK